MLAASAAPGRAGWAGPPEYAGVTVPGRPGTGKLGLRLAADRGPGRNSCSQ